jgi:hypothetical protein
MKINPGTPLFPLLPKNLPTAATAYLVTFIDNEEDCLSAESSVVDGRLFQPTPGLLKTPGHRRRRLLNPEVEIKLIRNIEQSNSL